VVLLTFLRTIILYGRLRSRSLSHSHIEVKGFTVFWLRRCAGVMLVLPQGDVEDISTRKLLISKWPEISRLPVARIMSVMPSVVCKQMLGKFASSC
jgi:hypothetical protein